MPLPTQVAGHGSRQGGGGGGHGAILRRPDGLLLKPLQAPPKGQRELGFYSGLAKSDDPVDLRIRDCVPEFFGVERICSREEFLILRDITQGFRLPAVMDVKIGSRTWGPDATLKKRQQEDSKYLGTKYPYGFSVLGCIVHPLNDDDDVGEADDDDDAADVVVCGVNKSFECVEGIRRGKDFGMQLRADQVHLIPEVFFDSEKNSSVALGVLECSEILVEKIAQILEAFRSQSKYQIYGSSLLMAYDAYAVRRFRKGLLTKDQLARDFVNVKLIDFAHAFPSNDNSPDENFVRGLSNLLALFKAFANQCKKASSKVVGNNGIIDR